MHYHTYYLPKLPNSTDSILDFKVGRSFGESSQVSTLEMHQEKGLSLLKDLVFIRSNVNWVNLGGEGTSSSEIAKADPFFGT